MALDPTLVNLAKAIRQQESGGDPTRRGASGEYGAYQFLPSTWDAYAKQAGVNVPLEKADLNTQNKVAYSALERMKREHPDWNVGNFASAWNAGEGEPNAYKGTFSTGKPSSGRNDKGVQYDVPGYAKAVNKYYQEFKAQSAPAPTPEPTPEPEKSQYGATFQAKDTDTPFVAGLKTLGNIPSSAINFGKGVIESVNPISTIGRIFSEIPQEFNALAKERGGVLPAIGAGLAQLPGTFIPEGTKQVATGDISGAQKTFTEDPVGQVLPYLIGGKWAAGKAGKGAAFDQAISRTADIATKPLQPLAKIPRGLSNLTQYGVAQATGLKPETISTAIRNDIPATLDRKAVADEIQAALDKRAESLSETGKAYGPIRSSVVEDTEVSPASTKTVKMGGGSDLVYNLIDAPNELLSLPELRAKYELLKKQDQIPGEVIKDLETAIKEKSQTDKVPARVRVDPSWFDRAIREETGLSVRGGKLMPKPTSSIRDLKDVGALQKTYNLWRPAFSKGYLTNEEFLNFRQDMAKLAKMDREIGKSDALENLSGIIRGRFNTAYRKQIPGLEALDKDFASQISDLKRLKAGFITKQGELNINRIANAVGKGKDLDLARLEEIIPGITQKIKIVKAIEDIQDAKGQKVGTYARGGLAAIGIGTANIPALVAAIISSPEIAVPLLRRYGMAKEVVEPVLARLKSSASTINNLPNRGQALPAGDNIEPNKALKGEDAKVQDASIRKFRENREVLVNQYLEENGNIINTDNARNLFKDVGYKGTNSAAVHEASSAVANEAFRRLLEKSDKKNVYFTAGGSGAGKTTATRGAMQELFKNAAAMVDGNYSKYGSSIKKIRMAREAGKDPTVVYVYRDPVEAWNQGVISRMLGDGPDAGRVVPLKTFLENTNGALDVVKRVLDEGVRVIGFRNGKKISEMNGEQIKRLQIPKNLELRLVKETVQMAKDGLISKEQYDALLEGLPHPAYPLKALQTSKK